MGLPVPVATAVAEELGFVLCLAMVVPLLRSPLGRRRVCSATHPRVTPLPLSNLARCTHGGPRLWTCVQLRCHAARVRVLRRRRRPRHRAAARAARRSGARRSRQALAGPSRRPSTAGCVSAPRPSPPMDSRARSAVRNSHLAWDTQLKLDRHHASDSEDSEDEQPAAAAPKASAKNRARREKKKAKATAAVRHDAAEADTFSEDDDEWQEVSAKKSRRADAGEDKTE